MDQPSSRQRPLLTSRSPPCLPMLSSYHHNNNNFLLLVRMDQPPSRQRPLVSSPHSLPILPFHSCPATVIISYYPQSQSGWTNHHPANVLSSPGGNVKQLAGGGASGPGLRLSLRTLPFPFFDMMRVLDKMMLSLYT